MLTTISLKKQISISKTTHLLTLIMICLLCANCTEVISDGDVHTLKSKFYVAVLFPLIGLLLLVGGIWACIRRLPEIWKSEMSLGWKGRRSKIIIIPLVGVLFILGTLPRMQYRVIVGPDYVEFHELGKHGRYEIKDIHEVSVIAPLTPGKQRRLSVIVRPLDEYFINESEIGTESFKKIVAAFEELKKK